MKASSTSALFKYSTQSIRLGKGLAFLQQDLLNLEHVGVHVGFIQSLPVFVYYLI